MLESLGMHPKTEVPCVLCARVRNKNNAGLNRQHL